MIEDPNIFNNNQETIQEIIINSVYTRFVKSTFVDEKTGNYTYDKTKPKYAMSKMQTKDFLAKIMPNSSSLEILPKNCRMKKMINGYTVYVVEDPPMLRTIKLNIRLDNEVEQLRSSGVLETYGFKDLLTKFPNPPYKMQLSFPYIVYILFFDNASSKLVQLNLYYRLHPLSSTSDYLLDSNLLNVHSCGNVCLGEKTLKQKTNMNENVENSIDQFWANEFNNDITSLYNEYNEQKEISTFLSWKYHTVNDPMFVFDIQWNQHERNIGDLIAGITNCNRSSEREVENFTKLVCFDTGQDETIDDNFRIQSMNAIPLFSPSEHGSRYLEVGSELEVDDKKYFVYSINQPYGKDGKADKITIFLEDEDGVITEHKPDKSFLTKVKDYYKKTKDLIFVDINGIKISAGTILESIDERGRKILKEIDHISKSRDGRIEARCGSSVFIIEEKQVVGAKIYDKNNVYFNNGLKAIIGNDYVIVKDDHFSIYPINFARLIEFKISSGYVYYVFKPLISSDSSPISYTDTNFSDIIDYNLNLMDRSALPVFRIGNCILNNDPKSEFKFHLFEDGFGLSHNTSQTMINDVDYYELQKTIININQIKAEILKDNKLKVDSFDLNLEFNIGDDIVIADYFQPLSYVTKIRKITAFKDDGKIIYVETITEDGEKIDVPYIDFTKAIDFGSTRTNTHERAPEIKIGLIRKIIPEAGDFKKGMKIRAKVTGLFAFPKKDVNEIVGIITDSGYKPMILCSNGHTIWCDEKSKELFDFIDEKHKSFKTLETTKHEYVSHKFQSGDIVNYPGNKTIYFARWDNVRKRISFTDDGILNQKSFSLYDRKLETRHCYQTIPIPRVNAKSVMKELVPVIPNYHGWFTIKKKARYQIMLEDI